VIEALILQYVQNARGPRAGASIAVPGGRCAERRPIMAVPGDIEGLPALLKGMEEFLQGLVEHQRADSDATPAVQDPQWHQFLDEHKELRLEFTDEQALEALQTAITDWDKRAPVRSYAGWVFSCCVAGQLTIRPTKAEVARVSKALGRLEKRGLVRCVRPRFQSNRWSVAPGASDAR
jgi:hypothetical protein